LPTIQQLAFSGYALWLAARSGKITWFIVTLVTNTFGIIEILYIFLFDERKKIYPPIL